MARPRRLLCRRCDRATDECGRLSKRGLCAECAGTAVGDAIEALVLHRGPLFEKWRHRVAGSVGAELPATEDPPAP